MTDKDTLFDYYMKSPLMSHKWKNYFSTYEELLKSFRGKNITFVEIGVNNGGSLFMWREYFGKEAKIIGVDNNPIAKKLENYGFEIFIGDQGDKNFWHDFYNKVGKIDVLLDDGSHMYLDQIITTSCSVPYIKDGGLIIIEDTHTSFMKSYGYKFNKNFFDFVKVLIKNIHKRHPYSQLKNSKNQYDQITKISIYESITAIHIDSSKNISNERVLNNKNSLGALDFKFEYKFINKFIKLLDNYELKFLNKKNRIIYKLILRVIGQSRNFLYFLLNFSQRSKLRNYMS